MNYQKFMPIFCRWVIPNLFTVINALYFVGCMVSYILVISSPCFHLAKTYGRLEELKAKSILNCF